MHPLWPVPGFRAVKYSSFPTQLIPDPISLAGCSIPRLFALRRVGKLVAVTAGKDCPTVKHGNPPTTPMGRAEEPMPFPAHVAGRCIETDRIAFVLPFSASIPLAII